MNKINFKKLNFWIIAILFLIVAWGILSLLLLATKNNPLTFWNVVIVQPWVSVVGISSFVNTFAILLLVGIAILITFKYRIYNFGVPGQMLISAIVTYIVAINLSNHGFNSRAWVIILLLIALIVGYLVGLLIAVLKVYFKIHEIISSILLTFIIWEGYRGLLASSVYHNQAIPNLASLKFSLISGPFNASNLFTAGIIIALLVFVIIIFLFSNRTLGFKLNVASKNPTAASYARINVEKQIFAALPISAAIAGIAGYLYFIGNNNNLLQSSIIPQTGFYGIIVVALAFYQLPLLWGSTFLITLFVRPIELNSFIFLMNQQLATVVLVVFIYLLAVVPFLIMAFNNSVIIQEKIQRLKIKIFKPKTTNDFLENQQLKPEFVTVNNTKYQRLKLFKIKIKNKFKQRKER